MQPRIARCTRSGKSFAEWSGPYATAAESDFDFPALLEEAVFREAEEIDAEADFPSHDSPPTTPAISLPPSLKPRLADLAECSESPPLAPPSDAANSRKARKTRKKHAHRANKRKRDMEEGFGGHKARPNATKKHKTAASPVQVDADASSMKAASTGFVGLDDGERDGRVYTLGELVGPGSLFGLRLQEWDGRTLLPIVDKDRRLIALFAGHPPDDNWDEEHRLAANELEQARLSIFGDRGAKEHRRGGFNTCRCGVSHGGGQHEPCNLANPPRRTKIIERLNNHRVFKRLAGFASSVLATWVPDLYEYYETHLGALYAGNHRLKRTFLSWIFTATTYNLGPRTVCYKHKDFANLPFGWCGVTALGNFDPKKGGHMVLWECGLVVEFPPGSTALLPSATISHSNAAISAQERRYSFTQYAPGGLFRWVENGFKTAVAFQASLTKAEEERRKQENATRFREGLAFFPFLRNKTST